jgi:hypothetical protein
VTIDAAWAARFMEEIKSQVAAKPKAEVKPKEEAKPQMEVKPKEEAKAKAEKPIELTGECSTCHTVFPIPMGEGSKFANHRLFGVDDMASIQSLEAFAFQCPRCQKRLVFSQRAVYYHKAMAIWLRPQSKGAMQSLVDRLRAEGIPKLVQRVVDSPARFAEAIRMYERGYDDCAMELLKLALKKRIMKERPDFQPNYCYFWWGEDGKEDYLRFYSADGDGISYPFDKDFFQEVTIAGLSLVKSPDLSRAVTIDEAWAVNQQGKALAYVEYLVEKKRQAEGNRR